MLRTCLKSSIGLIALVVAGPALATDLPPPAPVDMVDGSSGCLYSRIDVGGFTGASNQNIGEGILGEFGIGCQVTEGLRIEGVLGGRMEHQIGETGTGIDADLLSFTGFANILYDITNYGGWTPYIGGGAGAAYHHLSSIVAPAGTGDDNVAFAWNVQAGVAYDYSPYTKIDFGYRLTDLGNATLNGGGSIGDLKAHEFKIGIRYHFGSW